MNLSQKIIKNTGTELEKYFSKQKHLKSKENPISSIILINPKMLRDFDAGQIDLCTIERKNRIDSLILKIYEIKSQPAISAHQYKRLSNSAKLLSEMFDISVIIEILYPDF